MSISAHVVTTDINSCEMYSHPNAYRLFGVVSYLAQVFTKRYYHTHMVGGANVLNPPETMMVQQSSAVGAASSQAQPGMTNEGQPTTTTTTQPEPAQQTHVEDQSSDADISSELFLTKPEDQEEVWDGEKFVLSPARSEVFHKPSPGKGTATVSQESPEVTAMADLIKTLQQSIVQLQADMYALKDENMQLKHARRSVDGDGASPLKPLADIDKKDVEKPHKFKGDPMQWRSWSVKFASFLGRRDGRWPELIKAIQEHSNEAMTEDLEDKIFDAIGVDTGHTKGKALKFRFREQFQEYLENFTEGTAKAMVQAGGKDAVMETFRVMCDEGHSKRHRHLRKEYRAVTNPRQATFENVRQAIVRWETDVTEYENAADSRLDPRTRISCLEDICPDVLQQHLASKDGLKTYAEHKSAINDYLLERKRWTAPNSRGKINWLGLSEAKDTRDDDESEDEDEDPDNEAEAISEDFMQEVKATLLALVKGKQMKGGKAKNTGGGRDQGRRGPSAGSRTRDAGEPVCFECGEPMKTCGHSAKDCPIRVARVAAGGPARLPKGDGKGKGGKGGGGKGGGKGNGGKGDWPTRQAWNQFYPGPSQAQWRGWYPQQATAPPNKLNLFQQPLQLSAVSPLQALLNGPGTCYAIRPKDRVDGKRQPNFEHVNKFEALKTTDDYDKGSREPWESRLTSRPAKPSTGTGSSTTQQYDRSPGTSSFTTLPRGKIYPNFQTTKSTPEPTSVDFVSQKGKIYGKNAPKAVEQIKNSQDVENITTATSQSSRLTRSAATAQASVRVPSFGLISRGPRRTLAPLHAVETAGPEFTMDRRTSATFHAVEAAGRCPQSSRTSTMTATKNTSSSPTLSTSSSPTLSKDEAGRRRTPECAEKSQVSRDDAKHRVTSECAAYSIRLPVGSDQHLACWPNVRPDQHHACWPNREYYNYGHGGKSGTSMVVNLSDVIKHESLNKSRKRHAPTDSLVSLSPTCNLDNTRWQGRPGYCGAKDPAEVKAKSDDDAGDTGSREPWESRLTSRLAKPCTHGAGDVDTKDPGGPAAPTAQSNFLDSETLMRNLKDFVNKPRDSMANGQFAKLNVLNPVQTREGLKAVAPTKTVSSMGGKFEVLTSVVDSGATVPTMHPDDAAAYELLESQASRDGVEYEVANLETIPNLGEKKFAVLTSEGTIRGYQTQCAEIGKGKPLQAVRALVGSKHAVCFGLGENDDEHLIINKISGEVNKMRDDGINYLQDLLVVPPDQIENVQQQLYLLHQAQQNPNESDFGWQGR